MANTWYKYSQFISQNDSDEFDILHRPRTASAAFGNLSLRGVWKRYRFECSGSFPAAESSSTRSHSGRYPVAFDRLGLIVGINNCT